MSPGSDRWYLRCGKTLRALAAHERPKQCLQGRRKSQKTSVNEYIPPLIENNNSYHPSWNREWSQNAEKLEEKENRFGKSKEED